MNKKDNESENKKFEYEMTGNAFVGNLFSINEDLDNTQQNLIMYLESKKIYDESHKNDK